MNCDLYYLQDGKPMRCQSEHGGNIDALAMRFHGTMQNAVEVTKTRVEDGFGGSEIVKKRAIVDRIPRQRYQLLAIYRGDPQAGIWYDDFRAMRTPDLKGQLPADTHFTEGRECELPDRIKESA